MRTNECSQFMMSNESTSSEYVVINPAVFYDDISYDWIFNINREMLQRNVRMGRCGATSFCLFITAERTIRGQGSIHACTGYSIIYEEGEYFRVLRNSPSNALVLPNRCSAVFSTISFKS